MPTAKDNDTNTANVSASFSLRSAVMIAVVTVFANVVSTRVANDNAAVLRKLDDINTRVSRIEGALAPRTAVYQGVEGAGGTAAYQND